MTDPMTPEAALLRMPEAIRTAEQDLFKHQVDLDVARFRLKLMEADFAQKAAMAVDDAGKKRYPNEDARRAAVQELLERSDEARRHRETCVNEEAVVARIKAEIQYRRDVQANARALVLARSPAQIFFDGER